MTKEIKIKNCFIGGGNKIAIQSMTNTKTTNIDATVSQILGLEAVGCDIVRCSVPDEKSAVALKSICEQVSIPVVADIHFDYRLAIKAVESGVSKVRINPGNIGDKTKVAYVANFLKERKIPIRIGVNGGSLEKDLNRAYLAEAMSKSALRHVAMLEEVGFEDIIISVKSSNVKATIDAYRLLSTQTNYPLHLGVTEAGIYERGIIKSAIGIGSLLCDGIGDTIRVSLTDDPKKEVIAAKEILQCIGLDENFVDVISCPTCARTEINVQELAEKIVGCTRHIKKKLKVAVMGCVVNGPGEASDCDFGIAGGKEKSALFVDGKVVRTILNSQIESELMRLIEEKI